MLTFRLLIRMKIRCTIGRIVATRPSNPVTTKFLGAGDMIDRRCMVDRADRVVWKVNRVAVCVDLTVSDERESM